MDPPHTDGDANCSNCHKLHQAPGGTLNSAAGNANLCQSCHIAGGVASTKPFPNRDQALPWLGLPAGTNGSGTSHRWDSGVAGRVQFLGGAATPSTGTLLAGGRFTGAYAKTFTITITTPGNAGTAQFNWTATTPGGGAGTSVLTGTNVALNEGVTATFGNGFGVSFQANDQWNLSVRPDLSSPTNPALLANLAEGAVVCSTCHDPHSQANAPYDASAPSYDGPRTGAGRHYMRTANQSGQMCLECHGARNVTTAAAGSHPIGIGADQLDCTVCHDLRAPPNPQHVPLGPSHDIQCQSCHQVHFSPATNGTLLVATNVNLLCTRCHSLADRITPASHLNPTNSHTLWPGGQHGSTFPAKTDLSHRGTCLNCHQPHGWPDTANPTNDYPTLLVDREENLCYTCHDGSPAAVDDTRSVFLKANAHPVALSGLHDPAEAGTASAYASPGHRHSECADCHNPHQARKGYLNPATSSHRIKAVGRIRVTNGAAGTVPTYTYLPASSTNAPVAEYQLCFKCHSSWTTLPAGALDKAVELNPNNESSHAVEAAGKNATPAMATSLSGGTGLPHLTTNSTVWCSDCHNNDAIPTTISVLTNYTGSVPRGPHGSSVGANTNMSSDILRANYRVKLKPRNEPYAAGDFTLCFICHSAAPFATTSGDPRSDTNFRYHGKHLADYADNAGGGVPGNLDTPGNGTAGQGNAVCKECHYTTHSSKLTYHSSNRSYGRLVSFPPSVSGQTGTGAPSWSQGSRTCTLKCHGKSHNAESY